MYSVISTSGWIGDTWHYRGEFSKRSEAVAYAESIKRSDAKQNGYIVGVIGQTTICPDHHSCYIGDTRRVKTDRHLRKRRCHISTEYYERGE